MKLCILHFEKKGTINRKIKCEIKLKEGEISMQVKRKIKLKFVVHTKVI